MPRSVNTAPAAGARSSPYALYTPNSYGDRSGSYGVTPTTARSVPLRAET
ncbi:MAG TPA: hypothetical protein VFJ82_03115 [Longimicrobium sp.]|nr:hypothetical protein [Longimicrobium sp.]